MRALLVLLAFAALPAEAQYLYRCVNYQGEVTIQDAPCPAASKETSRTVVGAYEETASARAAKQRAVESAQASREAGSFKPADQAGRSSSRSKLMPWEPDRNNQACESAKRHREMMLKAAGPSRTFELLRALDDQVYKACRR